MGLSAYLTIRPARQPYTMRTAAAVLAGMTITERPRGSMAHEITLATTPAKNSWSGIPFVLE
jgi:hypothetical protein